MFVGVTWDVLVEDREFANEGGTLKNTGHQTLIITEQGEADDGGEGDGIMELLAPEAGGGSPHRV